MRKLPTGEPCAGEPHARFGGRGRREPFPTPIRLIRRKTNLDFRVRGNDESRRGIMFWECQPFSYSVGERELMDTSW